MIRIILLCIGILQWASIHGQVCSDSVLMKYKGIERFQTEEGAVGFRKGKKMIIRPNFSFAYNFYEKYTTAVDMERRYGIINTRGKWILTPVYDFISPVVEGYSITLFRGNFELFKKNEKVRGLGNYLDVNLRAFKQLAAKSDLPDREVITRVIDLIIGGDDTEKNKATISRALLTSVWSTRWVLQELGVI